VSLTETWRKWDIHSLYGLLFTASFKSFVELRPVGGGGGEIKWLVSYFNMLRRVVLSVPKHGDTRGYYDESEVETLRDWIIKQAWLRPLSWLNCEREQPTAVQNKISHLYLGCASISVMC
jgi:hypothetical protein